MSAFIKLRNILQENKPNWEVFSAELESKDLQKGDVDLLLRKAVESKISPFKDYCHKLVKYVLKDIGKEPISILAIPKVPPILVRSYQQPYAGL